MKPRAFFLGAIGAALIVLGLFLIPAMFPVSPGEWAAHIATIGGWALVIVAAGRPVTRYVRSALMISAFVAIVVGLAIIFGLPLLGDLVPRTLGLTSVLLGLIAIGWAAVKGAGEAATLLGGALTGMAVFAEILASIAVVGLPSAGIDASTSAITSLANAGHWTTLAGCAFVVILAGRWRLSREDR